PHAVYSPQWWDHENNFSGGFAVATPITLASGDERTGIDASLVITSISGTVTNASGTPLAGIQVDSQGDCGGNGTLTDAAGHYTIGGLRPCTYRVSFQDPHAVYSGQWWDHKDLSAGFG